MNVNLNENYDDSTLLSDWYPIVKTNFQNIKTALEEGEISEDQLPAGVVTSAKLADEAVVTNKIDNYAVTSNKLADGSVTSAKIFGDAVTGGKIAPYAVSTDKIRNESVTTEKLADGAVTSNKIAQESITSLKIAADAIVGGKIAPYAVSTDKIRNESVTTEKLADGAVTLAKLAFNPDFGASLFAKCSTAKATAAKTAVSDNTDFALFDGSIAVVRFENGLEAGQDITLDINNTGAKPVLYNGSENLGTYGWSLAGAGGVLVLVYDNDKGAYVIAGPDIASEILSMEARITTLENSGGVFILGKSKLGGSDVLA